MKESVTYNSIKALSKKELSILISNINNLEEAIARLRFIIKEVKKETRRKT